MERHEMIDRRERPRYSTKVGTFALLRATSIALSKIQDMGMGEIGFAVIKSKPVKSKDPPPTKSRAPPTQTTPH